VYSGAEKQFVHPLIVWRLVVPKCLNGPQSLASSVRTVNRFETVISVIPIDI
jgi:hypothetical protein